MNPIPSDGASSGQHEPGLCWPRLDLPEEGRGSSVATPLSLQVCDALERRLERLAAHSLPAQVAEDVMEMWRDLDAAQALLADGPANERRAGDAQRLLADLQAWLPVCECWIGLSRPVPASWPALALMAD